jgi:hypothetical protein
MIHKRVHQNLNLFAIKALLCVKVNNNNLYFINYTFPKLW